MYKSTLRDDKFPNGCIYSKIQIKEFFKRTKCDYPCWPCQHAPRSACIDIRLAKLDGTYIPNTREGPESSTTR